MISLKDFSIGFSEKMLLEEVTTSFPASKLTALIGRNGSGKSTLMKAMAGLNEKYKGEILIENKDLRNIPKSTLPSLLSYVNTQRPRMSNLKCFDVVALGRSPFTAWHGKIREKDRIIIEDSLLIVGMENYSNRKINTLSDGECQKIMIARAIAQDTKIILLDEPTSFLDLPSRNELVELLKNLTLQSGKTIIFSTHELDIALKYSDQLALIESPHLINLPKDKMIEYFKESQHPFQKYIVY